MVNEMHAKFFLAPGEWAVNLVLYIFKYPIYSLDTDVYTLITFITSLLIWINTIKYLLDYIRPKAND